MPSPASRPHAVDIIKLQLLWVSKHLGQETKRNCLRFTYTPAGVQAAVKFSTVFYFEPQCLILPLWTVKLCEFPLAVTTGAVNKVERHQLKRQENQQQTTNIWNGPHCFQDLFQPFTQSERWSSAAFHASWLTHPVGRKSSVFSPLLWSPAVKRPH